MESKKLSGEKVSSSRIIKRRSKSDLEGRNFFCEKCQKSYLSYPALYTHRRQKHENNAQVRNRGRPKKDQNENLIEKNRYNPINITFFAKEERTGKTPYNEINNCIDCVFIELYQEDEEKTIKKYDSLEDHPFLNQFRNDCHDIYKNVINLHEITDKIFIDYLNKMSAYCNKEYYIKLIKFLTLFREYINNINPIMKDNKEYTEINDAENIPKFCNMFLNDFLYPDNKESNFGFTKEESIDLIQNICYWIYDNNFTSCHIILKNYDN